MSILTTLLQTNFGLVSPPLLNTEAAGVALGVIKLMFIVAGLLYVTFAVIVTRQVHVMKNTLMTTFSPMVQLLGYIHLVVAILVLVFFLGL
ncbi:MAG TPA: DUF5657 family protein [Vitreimonas sp.]|nr:DUF5657 family protein [Vitreimonas sp.]